MVIYVYGLLFLQQILLAALFFSGSQNYIWKEDWTFSMDFFYNIFDWREILGLYARFLTTLLAVH